MISWLLLVLRTLRGMARSHILSEDHLRRTASTYITYYSGGRPHQGIEGIPECGPGLPRVCRPATGDGPIKFVAYPVLGGLHHDYRLAA